MIPDSSARHGSAQLLARLPRYLTNAWHPADAAKAWFGDGSSGENGIRSNANVAFALASWVRSQSDPAAPALAEHRDRAAAVLRYLCDSHRSGGAACAWGGSWGLEWQSSWWAAKMGLAVLQLDDLVAAELRAQVARVVAAEADRHLARHAPTGLFLDTKAEETAWDCEALAVALALEPAHANAPAWRAKLIEFSFNVFSVPQDRLSTEVVGGQKVADAVYTCNLHGDFSLENHGSYHFCYVASPLLSKAYCYLALRWAGEAIPPALQHHVDDVWALARNTFLTHRFAYLGGQDWARYTYGEYFIVPALSYLDATLSDPSIRQMQQARLDVLAAEAAGNDDGSFFGKRFTAGTFDGQLGKYETDTFACMALTQALASLAERAPAPAPVPRTPLPPIEAEFAHVSPEGQFCFWRTPELFFSFAWSYLGRDIPSLVFGPVDRDDMLEWHEGNGVGRVTALAQDITVGVRTLRRVGSRIEIRGETVTRDRKGRPLYETRLSIDFDRSTQSVRVSHRVTSMRRLWLVRIAGLTLRVPNDRFNEFQREVAAGGRKQSLPSRRPRDGVPNQADSKWRRLKIKLGWLDETLAFPGTVEVDGRLTIASANSGISLRRFGFAASTWKSLWVEEFQAPASRWRTMVKRGEVVLASDTTLRLPSRS